MNTIALRNAIKSALSGALSGYSIAWLGVNHSGARPYIEVSFPAADRTGGTLKGNQINRETGRVAAVVVTELGQGENPALAIADLISTALYEGKNIAFTGGTIIIRKPVDIRGGYPTERDYRLPCVIAYEANA